jgi:TPR repeat protein
MKKELVVIFFLLTSIISRAQMGVAKIKYQEAEEAYTANKFLLCLEKLDGVVEILKETNPKVQYLRITCTSKLVEKDPIGNFGQLMQLREYCKGYLNEYDKIPDLEEKYKTVYEISESIKAYPQNEEEYQQVIMMRKRGRVYRYQSDSLNFNRAEDFFTQAYKKGDMRSLVELANLYKTGGYGVEEDLSKSYRCYQKLADNDIAEGLYYIGLAYLNGSNGYQVSSQKAYDMIEAAAEKKYVPAMATNAIIQFCYFQYKKSGTDKAEIANIMSATSKKLLAASFAGADDGEFNYYMGKAYSLGVISTGVDQIKAVEYFTKSANFGNIKGKNALGFYYKNGMGGLQKSYTKAFELFTFAAERMLAAAEYNLYTLYSNGAPDFEKNSKLQQYWFDRYTINNNKSIDQVIINETKEIY